MKTKDKIFVIGTTIVLIVYIYYLQYLEMSPYIAVLIIVLLLGIIVSKTLSLP